MAFHRRTLVFDSLSLNYVLEEPYTARVLEGGVNATIVTFAAEDGWGSTPLWDATLRLVESCLRQIDRNPLVTLATKVDDVQAACAQGKLAVFMGFQSASMIGRDFGRLALLSRLGLRCIQLTFNGANLYGDGWGERRNAGLSVLGRELIEAVNDLPMVLDLSHCGSKTTLEAAELARVPVCTHGNAYSVNPNDRCKSDSAVEAIAAKGGMIGVQFSPSQVKTGDPQNATVEDVVDHIDYFTGLVGDTHVGVGTGFTEGLQERGITFPESDRWRRLRPDTIGTIGDFFSVSYPRGVESIRLLPNLTQVLFDRGYTEPQITAILGGNWLETLRHAIA